MNADERRYARLNSPFVIAAPFVIPALFVIPAKAGIQSRTRQPSGPHPPLRGEHTQPDETAGCINLSGNRTTMPAVSGRKRDPNLSKSSTTTNTKGHRA